MAVTVNKYFEIEKEGIVYIPAMKVSQDTTETIKGPEDKDIVIPKIEKVWENTDIDLIVDEEVKTKAIEVWTTENINTFKEARK